MIVNLQIQKIYVREQKHTTIEWKRNIYPLNNKTMDKKKIFFDIETVVETTDYENYPKKDIRSERYCNDI